MRSTHLCWSLILAFVLASPAFPAIRPSFRLDHSAWKATHVVLGITTLTDGTFEVVESWKGDLQAGARLVIPELRPLADAEPISVRPKSSEPRFCEPGSQLIPKEPPGSTVILFLVRSTDQVPTTPGSKAEIGGWKPSDIMDSMLASVVWIDSGELYAFEQVVNPGVPLLCKLPLSETQARDRVTEISETQAQIATATSLQNSEERAERLKPYVSSDIFPARRTAITELGKTGPSAVPVISSMLDDSSFADAAPDLVDALAEAGGEVAGLELNRHLQKELKFWKAKGPTLRHGWINEDKSVHAPLRERYSVTYELILGLEKTRYTPALNTAIEFRGFWRSLPQLNDGFSEFIGECDKLIRDLRTSF